MNQQKVQFIFIKKLNTLSSNLSSNLSNLCAATDKKYFADGFCDCDWVKSNALDHISCRLLGRCRKFNEWFMSASRQRSARSVGWSQSDSDKFSIEAHAVCMMCWVAQPTSAAHVHEAYSSCRFITIIIYNSQLSAAKPSNVTNV